VLNEAGILDTMDKPLTLQDFPGSARLVIQPPTIPYDDDYFHDIHVTLSDDGMSAQSTVRLARFEHPPLVDHLTQLATDWKGWTGIRAWSSIGQGLLLDAQHDGLGHVTVGPILYRQGHESGSGLAIGWSGCHSDPAEETYAPCWGRPAIM
jgi:hypothetical protein